MLDGIGYDDVDRSTAPSCGVNSRKKQKVMDTLEGIVRERSNDSKHLTSVIVLQLGSSDGSMILNHCIDDNSNTTRLLQNMNTLTKQRLELL